jgi:arabinan endo-1,5-alpha-L-arabinosidase
MSGRMAGHFIFALALVFSVLRGLAAPFVPAELSGQTSVHDPSTIVRDGGRFYLFGTGPGLRAKTSADLVHWSNAPSVFRRPPAWTGNIVSNFNGSCWAPDIIRANGKYLLYYSVSAWGKQTSAIGLAINATLDAAATNYLWTDGGIVIQSTPKTAYNCIDPSVFLDADGRLWLAFGSFWEGIFLTELDPQTGLRLGTNPPLHRLAWSQSIEAPCLTRQDRFYYLFVNWGQCCQGTNSTYEVRVGRAEKITGPYLDRDGKKLTEGGGTPFLRTQGRFIGPGHIAILPDGANTRFSYHYYDADRRGRSHLALGKIDWTDGWPKPVN